MVTVKLPIGPEVILAVCWLRLAGGESTAWGTGCVNWLLRYRAVALLAQRKSKPLMLRKKAPEKEGFGWIVNFIG
tara:strand:+ start:379 stop:603 length:225 start_codon:yes stop_codon:yes gene_type:complete